MLDLYNKQTKCLVALDSIIFGFDGENLKVLLVKRGIEENKETWSLMGGWLQENEGLNEAADRILFEHTGLKDVYLEQLASFGNPNKLQSNLSPTFISPNFSKAIFLRCSM